MRIKKFKEREWHAYQVIEQGWSRHTLETNLKRDLYQQQAVVENKTSNFQPAFLLINPC
jgi:hypothetical protein